MPIPFTVYLAQQPEAVVRGNITGTSRVEAATVDTMTLNATDSVSTSIMGSTTFTLTVK